MEGSTIDTVSGLAEADVLEALRQATAPRHARLDSSLAIGAAGATLADYRAHLCMLRAWLGPLEQWLAAYADGPQGAQAPPLLRRSMLIDADLAHAAMPAAASVCATALPGHWPRQASAAYRWGVCYVIEGSQLGGAVLYQRLHAALAPHPLQYLRGEAGGPGPRWRAFLSALRAAVVSGADIAEACSGACDAFDRILASAPAEEHHTTSASLPGNIV